MEYDKTALSIAIVTKRRGANTITMRDAADQIGVSLGVVQKAETRKPVSEKSFTKICAWLNIPPGEFFKANE